MKELCAIVLAAGEGRRMKSAVPKVLHQVGGRPMVAAAVEVALKVEAQPVVAVVGVGREQVEEALKRAFPNHHSSLRFAHQHTQSGTADAVATGLPQIGDQSRSVLILYGDVPNLCESTVKRLIEARREAQTPLALLSVELDDPTGYGRVIRDADNRVSRVIEERDCSPEQRSLSESNAGIYVVDRQLLGELLARVDNDNAQGELYLTDLVELAASRGGVTALLVEDAEELRGVNDREALAMAEASYRRRRNRQLMAQGVTFIDPETSYVEHAVELEQDVTLHPGVVLKGKSRVGSGSVIDAYSVLEDAEVGRGCSIGPYARLRPGTRIQDGAKVGNFVETKKTTLGPGSKANHLSYLGDATIGAGVNVGAGTITCNYDGKNKHPTTIHDGAFIGSDVQLVAPVEVGQGAYVGAGTTVTRDVPAGSLAITRVKQRTIEGYAERLRKRRESEES